MNAACFLLLRIDDPRKARSWLRETLPEITTAADKTREQLSHWSTALNLALTWSGLKALGLPAAALETFPAEFQEGMAARADILGDTGDSAPEGWEFGGPSGQARREELHLLLMLYGTSEEHLSALLAAQRARLQAGGLHELAAQQATRLRDAEGHAVEHFGFRDGLSQPLIDEGRPARHGLPAHAAPIKAGEFLLGHENEYAETPDPPRLPAEMDPKGVLPEGREPGWRELGRDGTYLVLRKLRQDVEGFQRFLEAHKDLAAGGTDALKKQWLAAKLMGRWPDGTPLRPGEDSPPAHGHPLDNTFGFREKDPEGYGCPVASHIRRANPRDALPPNAEISEQVSRRHRILRRGFTYSHGPDKGMYFIALNANIARQFEFLQQTWLNNGKFGGRYEERDPLVAEGAGRMTLPHQPLRRCMEGIEHFVTVRGGGYFFLPGMKALEFLASGG